MEEGTIVSWLVADGEQVKTGQELAEVETDKATVTFAAEADGLLKILVAAGTTVALGSLIAHIHAPGENGADGVEPTPLDPAIAVPASPAQAAASQTAKTGETDGRRTSVRVSATPVARRLAESLNIDLRALVGSGPRGRIVQADVQDAAARCARDAEAQALALTANTSGPLAVSHKPAPAEFQPPLTAKGAASARALSRTQQLIARRMAESRATVTDLDLSIEVDMEAASELRATLKAGRQQESVIPSHNDIVVMACAKALSEQRQVNSAYVNGQVERFARINVGIAVALPDALVVPTLFDADRRTLGDIARTSKELVAKVREGTATPPELTGATFTVSNLGMYGVDCFTAVINPPQAAILAVGAVKPRPVVHDGEIAARRTMMLTLAADHRVLYGADGARFLARVRDFLERPIELLVG